MIESVTSQSALTVVRHSRKTIFEIVKEKRGEGKEKGKRGGRKIHSEVKVGGASFVIILF